MLTQSRPAKRVTGKNGTRLLKPAIGLKRPEKGDEGKHDEKNNVVLTLTMPTAPPMRFPWPILEPEPPKSGFHSKRS